jgi:hypothetical protein
VCAEIDTSSDSAESWLRPASQYSANQTVAPCAG